MECLEPKFSTSIDKRTIPKTRLDYLEGLCYITNNMDRPFITTGEIIRLANVHPNTVAIWRTTRKIVPQDKVGSSYLYDRKAVMEFLEARKNRLEAKEAKKKEDTKNE